MSIPTYTDPDDRKLPHQGEIIAPGCGDPALLTRSPIRSIASAADLAPPPSAPARKTPWPTPAASATVCTTATGA